MDFPAIFAFGLVAFAGFGLVAILISGARDIARTADFKACPACRLQIVASAGTCPKCGHRFPSLAWIVLLALLAIIAAGVLAFLPLLMAGIIVTVAALIAVGVWAIVR